MTSSYFSTDTIVAIATSLAGDGGVGIIRLSGPRALGIARLVCRDFQSPDPRYLHRIEIVESMSREVLDDGLAVYFPEGQSFTGEEVVELQLHGGRFSLQAILQELIKTGLCRLALPGEFTFRAVRNGKMTLTGAEALSQLIKSKSLFEAQAARRKIARSRLEDFDGIAVKVRDLLAQTELSIDFVDQDVEVISARAMENELTALLERIGQLLQQMEMARRIAQGLSVALIGLPNAGKSTLFNALLSEDRAIVSPEAGTTRDIVTEEIRVGPYCLRLADTAGLRATAGTIEQEGIARAREAAASADLSLLVIDGIDPCGSHAIRREAADLLINNKNLIIAFNKIDAMPLVEAESRCQALSIEYEALVIPVSASKGLGIERLLSSIKEALDRRYGAGLSSFLPTEYQMQMLLRCRQELAHVEELIRAQGLGHPELVSAGLVSAVRALTDLVGETTPDTVLAKIFSEFCIGK